MSSLSLVLGLMLAANQTPSGSATVPLQDLIPLYAERQAPPPPTEALVVKSELKGHLTPEALLVEAHFEVEVLTSERWTRVQLLHLDPDVYLTELPTIEGAAVGALDGQLCFVSQKPGRYAFDLRLTVRPSGPGPERSAELRYGPHTAPVPLQLEADANAFTLIEPQTFEDHAQNVYPRQGVVRVRWRTVAVPAVVRQPVRPPLEPSITEARASWISTLEGKATVRLRYSLTLDREQDLELELPEDLHLKQALLNAVPLAATEKEGHVLVKVAPARMGETQGALELVLTQELGSLHLSGQLRLALPRVTWPVASLYLQAHLPAVFNYHREGGSMEQYEASEQEEPPSQAAPPGKVLHFRQYLMATSAPSLELGYSVDISTSYFR